MAFILPFSVFHPEYEVDDFKDGKRYLDFAYIRPAIRICLEVDGYGPHLKNISRWQFSDNLERQNQLVIDGWTVIRFSYDQVNENPRRCQQIVQQVIGRWLGDELDQTSLSFVEKEVLRLAIRKGEAISPKEVEEYLKLSDKTVRKVFSQLVDNKMLIPASGIKRIRTYRLGDQVKHPIR
ncbi:DNA-binding response regulator [Neobacillus drentensis]|uniref:DNA-binding response regulator n=1 Tax=Neobacillus drentensis TaxID=220684 RepID=UPI0030025FDF